MKLIFEGTPGEILAQVREWIQTTQPDIPVQAEMHRAVIQKSEGYDPNP